MNPTANSAARFVNASYKVTGRKIIPRRQLVAWCRLKFDREINRRKPGFFSCQRRDRRVASVRYVDTVTSYSMGFSLVLAKRCSYRRNENVIAVSDILVPSIEKVSLRGFYYWRR